MLIRRNNWPAFLAVAIFGPLLGAFLAAEFLALGPCPSGEGDDTVRRVKMEQAARSAEEKRDYDLQLPDGDHIALDEIAPERSVAVVVMKGPWCPVCKRQLKRLSDQMANIQAADATVVGLTSAGPERTRKLRKQLGLNLPILSDTSKNLLRDLDMWRKDACHAIPGVVFIDESGTITGVHRGRYPGKPQDEFVLDTLRSLSP